MSKQKFNPEKEDIEKAVEEFFDFENENPDKSDIVDFAEKLVAKATEELVKTNFILCGALERAEEITVELEKERDRLQADLDVERYR